MKNGIIERSGALQLDQIEGHSLLVKNHTIKIISTSYVTERTVSYFLVHFGSTYGPLPVNFTVFFLENKRVWIDKTVDFKWSSRLLCRFG